ncbi:MAG: hypothetical protein ACRDTG_18675 [Pseudonocardiaceae bacterium]
MINPAGIPQIPGDMDVLTRQAEELGRVGPEFSGTGQQVNSTWQQLAGVYEAPEVGQLLAATGPVQTTTASVGEDIATVGRALATYAATVKQIQKQLDALRAQAQTLVAEAKADKDSESDLEKVGEFVGIGGDDDDYAERSNELVDQVNAQVAAFAEAQRVCANTINALYGGVQYRADDGDANQEPGEYGFTAEQLNAAFEQGQELPWGSYAETDTGIVGGVWDGMKNFAGDLGALIGRDPVTGDWSLSTAGTAWKGLGTFALALVPPVTVVNAFTDLPGLPQGTLHNTLLNAGKGLIAYDEWGKGDNARAGGMAGFNILSAIVGTKGAGAALRGLGAGAQASRLGLVSRAGLAMVRSGEFIGRLPTTESLFLKLHQHVPHLNLPGHTPEVNAPHHTDTPRVETPNPGTVGDNLAGTGRSDAGTPSAPNVPHAPSAPDVAGPRSGDAPTPQRSPDAPSTHHAPPTSDTPRSPDTPSGPDGSTPDAPSTHGDHTPDTSHPGDHTSSDHPPSSWSGARYVENVDPGDADIYNRIRDNAHDTARIAENTGIPQGKVDQIKDHLFHREHDLPTGPGQINRGNFSPDSDIADLWPKAETGRLNPEEAQRFHRLIAHEYVESSLMNNGMPYRSSHPSTWDPVLGNHPTPQHHGAHDLAPHVDPARDPFGHWERSLGRDHPGVTEIASDLSNLDDIIHQILGGGR